MDKNKVAVELFNSKAQLYQEKYMDVGLYKATLDLLCGYITKDKAAVLDLACGPGNISKYLLNKRPNLAVFGVDLAKNMIDLARINNPTAQFEVMDCRSISDLPNKYDVIICGFCLPYLNKKEALQLIKDAARLLHPKGLLYISTMEDDYEKSKYTRPSDGGPAQIFTHYHHGSYLTESIQQNGLQIREVKRQDFPVTTGEPITDLLLIAQK